MEITATGNYYKVSAVLDTTDDKADLAEVSMSVCNGEYQADAMITPSVNDLFVYLLSLATCEQDLLEVCGFRLVGSDYWITPKYMDHWPCLSDLEDWSTIVAIGKAAYGHVPSYLFDHFTAAFSGHDIDMVSATIIKDFVYVARVDIHETTTH